MADLVSKAIKNAGCRIKRRSRIEVEVHCDKKLPEGLHKLLKRYGFQLFSSAPSTAYGGGRGKFGLQASRTKGRDYWYQTFRGSDKAWREYLRTGVMP